MAPKIATFPYPNRNVLRSCGMHDVSEVYFALVKMMMKIKMNLKMKATLSQNHEATTKLTLNPNPNRNLALIMRLVVTSRRHHPCHHCHSWSLSFSLQSKPQPQL